MVVWGRSTCFHLKCLYSACIVITDCKREEVRADACQNSGCVSPSPLNSQLYKECCMCITYVHVFTNISVAFITCKSGLLNQPLSLCDCALLCSVTPPDSIQLSIYTHTLYMYIDMVTSPSDF